MITAQELRDLGAELGPEIPDDAETHYECDYDESGVVVHFLLFDELDDDSGWVH